MPLPLPLRQCNTLLTYSLRVLRVSPFSLVASIMYLEIYSFVSIAIELELEFQVKEQRKMRPVIDFIFHWSLCQNLWFPWEYKICKFQIIQRLFKRSLIAFFSYIHNIGIVSVVAVPSLQSIQQILCIIFLSDSHWIFFRFQQFCSASKMLQGTCCFRWKANDIFGNRSSVILDKLLFDALDT